MKTEEVLASIGMDDAASTQTSKKKNDADARSTPSATHISVPTIDLPEQAPKKLLLDLKKVLETFPGKEKIQLRIGEQTVPLPLTVTMSTILEKKLEEVMRRYDPAMKESPLRAV